MHVVSFPFSAIVTACRLVAVPDSLPVLFLLKMKGFVLLLVVAQCCLIVQGLKIAAYNIRIFGRSKLQNQVAMNMITQVRRTYNMSHDIALILNGSPIRYIYVRDFACLIQWRYAAYSYVR